MEAIKGIKQEEVKTVLRFNKTGFFHFSYFMKRVTNSKSTDLNQIFFLLSLPSFPFL